MRPGRRRRRRARRAARLGDMFVDGGVYEQIRTSQLHECSPLNEGHCHPGGELLGLGPEAGYDRAWGGGQAGEGAAAEVAVAPVTLALVDAGGGEEWLELVRGALAAAVEALPPSALFGLVTFGTHARTRAHTGPCVSAHRLGRSWAAHMCLPKLIVAPVFRKRLLTSLHPKHMCALVRRCFSLYPHHVNRKTLCVTLVWHADIFILGARSALRHVRSARETRARSCCGVTGDDARCGRHGIKIYFM